MCFLIFSGEDYYTLYCVFVAYPSICIYLYYHHEHVLTQLTNIHGISSILLQPNSFTAELVGESFSLCFLRMTEASRVSILRCLAGESHQSNSD